MSANEGLQVRSPLAGTVLEVLVRIGAEVSAGEGLILLESMKMEVPVNAPVSGIVTAVPVLVGDAVSAGMTLVVLA